MENKFQLHFFNAEWRHTIADYCSSFFQEPRQMIVCGQESLVTWEKLCGIFEILISAFMSKPTRVDLVQSFYKYADSFLSWCMEMIKDYSLNCPKKFRYEKLMHIVISTMTRLCDNYDHFRIALREKQKTPKYDQVLCEYSLNSLSSDRGANACTTDIMKSLRDNKEKDREVELEYVKARNINLEEITEQSQQALQEIEEDKMCKVCNEEKISRVFIPCGHACLCGNCLERMRRRNAENPENTFKCPLCNILPASVIKLHMDLLKY